MRLMVDPEPGQTRDATRLELRWEAARQLDLLRRNMYEAIDLWVYSERAKEIITDEAAAARPGALDA